MEAAQCGATFFRFERRSIEYPTKLQNWGASVGFLGAKRSPTAPEVLKRTPLRAIAGGRRVIPR
jgi:hypothetical protein